MGLLQKRPSLHAIRQSPRIVKLLFVQQFMEGFVPIAALYAIMFERVGGLSLEQIGWLFSIWSLAYVIAELPSGVLADYWSRRNVIIVGGVLRAAGLMVWMLWPGFVGYAIGFALWGAMIACSSGAVIAYLQSELRAIGKGRQFAKYFGWIMSGFSLGMLMGYFVAAVLTLNHAAVLTGLGVASSVVFVLLLMQSPEHSYKKEATYLKTLKAGLKEITQSKKLRYICYVMFTVFMVIGVLEELLPRLYAGFGLNDSAVAIVQAVALVASIFLLTRMEAFVRFSVAKQVLALCLGIVFLLAGLYIGSWGAVGLVVIFNLVFHLFRPVFQHHIQEVAKSDQKATIGSIPGLAAGLLGALAYVIIGAVAQATSERWSIGLYGAFWLLISLVLAYMGRKHVIRDDDNLSLAYLSGDKVQ